MTKEEGPCVSPRRVRVAQKGHGSATAARARRESFDDSTYVYVHAPVRHARGVSSGRPRRGARALVL